MRGFLGTIAKDRNFSFDASGTKIDVKSLRIPLSEEIEDFFSGEMISQPLDAEKKKSPIWRYDPLEKRDRPNYIFPNISGNTIKNNNLLIIDC